MPGRRVLWKSAATWCCVFLCLLRDAALGANANDQPRDSRDKRAGDVSGLEDGRISLAKVSSMLTSSVHVEVRGNHLVRALSPPSQLFPHV